MKVLHVAAEIFPLVKTGGLADVAGALPPALARAGADVRIVLPGLPQIADAVLHQQHVIDLGPAFGAARVTLRRGTLPYSHVPAYVIDAPYLYRREGSPYQTPRGVEWPDNLLRFALLGWVAAHLAAGELDPHWTPEVVHAHDWHAAMACPYMAAHWPTRAASVFTIHNLAFQGLFPQGDFRQLDLPARKMTTSGLEFHGQLSFMKAGLSFADQITTVSPSYAREIATPEFGCGLDGVIRSREAVVSGILNGIDVEVWDPERDPGLAMRYRADALDGKATCKRALQEETGLVPQADRPLFGLVSRLTEQKGMDLLLDALPTLLEAGGQLIVQGSGDAGLEAAFRDAAARHPGRIAVKLGYDEAMAHRIIAGSDAILVPSRFEPCGLTQLYGLRYGTLPVVRRVGGLADTVVDCTDATLADGTATGFAFEAATGERLAQALRRAAALYAQPLRWQQVVRQAMAEDHSWTGAATAYMQLYARAIESRLMNFQAS